MEQTNQLLPMISRIFLWLLPVFALIAIIFVVILLLELVKFSKQVEATTDKVDNLMSRIETMQTTMDSSLEEPELLDVNSYRDLQFKSALANNMLIFGLDNYDNIYTYTRRFVRGYKRFKKKRKK